MIKLVAVAGKIRGEEFELQEGENSLGRDGESDISLSIDGVSKNHAKLTVNGESIFIEDLNSSNGTFVNGKLVKSKTCKHGDKLALPNVIFQIVYVKEKIIQIKKQVAKAKSQDDDDSIFDDNEKVPTNILGKFLYFFKHKIMPVIYGFNEQYDWKVIFAISLFFFILLNIYLNLKPVLDNSKRLLIKEIALRGKQYAQEVARFNRTPLSRGEFDKIDTRFLDNADGVVSYELFDDKGHIFRPLTKMNTIVHEMFSVEVFEKVPSSTRGQITQLLNNGDIGIGLAIKVYDSKLQVERNVGYIAIRFAPVSLVKEAANNQQAYAESIVTSMLVAIIFFGIIYFATIRPITELHLQMEACLRGRQKEIERKYIFSDLDPLTRSVNSLINRFRELQDTDENEFQDVEGDEEYVIRLKEFMLGSGIPTIVLNSEKLIQFINPQGEDLTGLRESLAAGTDLLDSMRDQGVAATVTDLCEKTATDEGRNYAELYDIQGVEYNINAVGMVGKDGFAKAFYITFIKDA